MVHFLKWKKLIRFSKVFIVLYGILNLYFILNFTQFCSGFFYDRIKRQNRKQTKLNHFFSFQLESFDKIAFFMSFGIIKRLNAKQNHGDLTSYFYGIFKVKFNKYSLKLLSFWMWLRRNPKIRNRLFIEKSTR